MNKVIDNQRAGKIARIETIFYKEEEVILPNNNSFYVFGSKTGLTPCIEAVLNKIIKEQADKEAVALVHYSSDFFP